MKVHARTALKQTRERRGRGGGEADRKRRGEKEMEEEKEREGELESEASSPIAEIRLDRQGLRRKKRVLHVPYVSLSPRPFPL